MIQEAIAGCARVNMEIGRALTTHMTAPLRIDVLRALAEITVDDLDVLDELDELIDQFNAAAKKSGTVTLTTYGASIPKPRKCSPSTNPHAAH